jgi:hypothetical protein
MVSTSTKQLEVVTKLAEDARSTEWKGRELEVYLRELRCNMVLRGRRWSESGIT